MLPMPPIKLSGFGTNLASFLEMESLEFDSNAMRNLGEKLIGIFDCLVEADTNGTKDSSNVSILGTLLYLL